jgi:hypothetical protein
MTTRDVHWGSIAGCWFTDVSDKQDDDSATEDDSSEETEE